MADDSANQVPPNAIPPKAVPPTATRPVADPGPSAAPASGDSPTVRRQAIPQAGAAPVPGAGPRTVRLKPIQAPVSGGAASGLPPVSPSAPVGSAEATDAIKRMTARIAMMTGSENSDPQLANRATAPLASTGVLEGVEGKDHKKTSRISLPGSTAVIAAVADNPKTIKIRPTTGPQPATAGLSPEAVPPAPRPTSSLGSQAAAKSKTSRIPLESAMLGTQIGDSAGIPKTIKLKRPGEMSSAKVALPGASTAAGAADAESASITQKKTIRVKRPMVPGAASVGAEGAATGDGASAPTPILTPVPLVAPERGNGWFVALAALGIIVVIGLVLIFSAQTFAPNSWTKLDQQFSR